MNNKGFTVVELLASFTLTMIIVVFLFEIVMELKNVYIDDAVKTKILNKNAIVATNLNAKFDAMNNGAVTINCLSDVMCTVFNGTDSVTISINQADGKSIQIQQTGKNAQNILMPDEVKSIDSIKSGAQSTDPYCFDSGSWSDTSKYIRIGYIVRSDYLKDDIKYSYVYTFD